MQWAVREGSQLEEVVVGLVNRSMSDSGGGRKWTDRDREDITLVAFDHDWQEETRMDRQ